MRPHRQQPIRLPWTWDSPGKNTGVGCHFLLQCMKVKSEREVARRVRLLATLWTAAYQAPPSMGFSRQEYWSGVPWEPGKKKYMLVDKGKEAGSMSNFRIHRTRLWVKAYRMGKLVMDRGRNVLNQVFWEKGQSDPSRGRHCLVDRWTDTGLGARRLGFKACPDTATHQSH